MAKKKETDEKRELVVKTLGNKIDVAKKKLVNTKNKKTPKQIKLEKALAEVELLKKEVAKENKKTVNNLIKAFESIDYKKILKEISELTDDTFLLDKIVDVAVAHKEEIKGKFVTINELIKSGEEKDEKKVYELMGYNYNDMMKQKEEEELAGLEDDETETELNEERKEDINKEEVVGEEHSEENKNENNENDEETTGY